MMRASSSSSSSNSKSLTKRIETIFKKAHELSILCGIEVCVIHYGADGELKTWPPEEREKVKDMALRYKKAKKRKKSFNIHDFIDQEKKDESAKKKKKQKKNVKYPDWYPIFDHYSPHQLSQLVQSLEQTRSKLQERIRVVESQKQENTNLVHHESDQIQPLNPSKFSLYMYKHGDATFSELPLSASHSNQFYQNHLMQQDNQLFGFDQNISNRNIPCSSNTQPYSSLLSVQESAVNNYGLLNYLIQEEEQNMFMMSEFTKGNVLQQYPSISNTVPLPHEFSYDFQQNPYGDVADLTSFCQDMFYENSLLQTSSSLPSPHTTRNSSCLSTVKSSK